MVAGVVAVGAVVVVVVVVAAAVVAVVGAVVDVVVHDACLLTHQSGFPPCNSRLMSPAREFHFGKTLTETCHFMV